jgi:hypothetical protein
LGEVKPYPKIERRGNMIDVPVQPVVATFQDEGGADEALKEMNETEEESPIKIPVRYPSHCEE